MCHQLLGLNMLLNVRVIFKVILKIDKKLIHAHALSGMY